MISVRVSQAPTLSNGRRTAAYEVVDELLLWCLVDAAGLVLENDVVVPPPLDTER